MKQQQPKRRVTEDPISHSNLVRKILHPQCPRCEIDAETDTEHWIDYCPSDDCTWVWIRPRVDE